MRRIPMPHLVFILFNSYKKDFWSLFEKSSAKAFAELRGKISRKFHAHKSGLTAKKKGTVLRASTTIVPFLFCRLRPTTSSCCLKFTYSHSSNKVIS